jgi:hypothetical protein
MADIAPRLPDRKGMLDEVFAQVEEKAPSDAEQQRAETLGRLTDQVLEGRTVPKDAPLDGDLGDTIRTVRMIHAAMHGCVLATSAREQALDEAVDFAAPAAPASALSDVEPASGRGAGTGWWVGAATLAAGIAAVALVWNITRTPPGPRPLTRAEQVARRAQRLRVLLPGPFPRDQTASHRINVIYSDRMRAYRWQMIRRMRAPGKTAGTRVARTMRTERMKRLPVRPVTLEHAIATAEPVYPWRLP